MKALGSDLLRRRTGAALWHLTAESASASNLLGNKPGAFNGARR